MSAFVAVMGSVAILVLFAAFLAKFRSSMRNGLEKLTGIKTVRKGIYNGGLDDQTYEGIILETPVIILAAALVSYYPIVVALQNFSGYIGFVVIFLFPFILELLRIKTFSDSSILEETGIGYHPAFCFLFSIAAGGFMTIRGFSMLNFPDMPLELAYFVIVLGLFAQAIPLFPDYIEKILHRNLRSKIGLRFMGILAVVLFIVTHIIWIVVQSKVFGI